MSKHLLIFLSVLLAGCTVFTGFQLDQRYGKDQNAPSLSMLWDGDGTNRNAALTVFRHFDSATVVQGLVGERPQTALVMGYPLLERIHYPNAFFLVPADQLSAFLTKVGNLHSEQDYGDWASRFAIRRTDRRFWAHSDALHEAYRKAEPMEAALFDFNRFENR